MHYVDLIGLIAVVGLMVAVRLVYEASDGLCFELSYSYHAVVGRHRSIHLASASKSCWPL